MFGFDFVLGDYVVNGVRGDFEFVGVVVDCFLVWCECVGGYKNIFR